MIWIIMILTGLFTFSTRFVMLTNYIARGLPNWLIDALGFVPIAVLTAIIVPNVLIDPITQKILLLGNERLVAAIIATVIALLTRNVITTICSGLCTIWFLQWWF